MLSRLITTLRNERGATAVEYSVMVVLIAAVIVISVGFLGGTTSSSIDCAGKSWQNKTAACSAGGSSSGTTGSTTGGTTGSTTGGSGTTTGSTTGSSTGGSSTGNGTGNATGNGTGNTTGRH